MATSSNSFPNEMMETKSTLFPAYCGSTTTVDRIAFGGEWLQNSSYTSECEKTVLNYQREEKCLNNEGKQNISKETEIQEVECNDDIKEIESQHDEYYYIKRKRKKHKKHKSKAAKDVAKRVKCETPPIQFKTSSRIFIEEMGLLPEHAFRVDRKPDKQNLAFNTFYHKHTATYYNDNRPPLGLQKEDENEWIIRIQKRKSKKKSDDDRRYWNKHNSSLTNETEQVLKPLLNEKNNDAMVYIPIEISVNELKEIHNPINETVNPLGVYDNKTELYIQGKAQLVKPEVTHDITFTSLSDEPYKSTLQQELYLKTQEFNKTLRENPTDEQMWLAFVAFQDKLISSDSSLKKSRQRDIACSEKKVAIIDKALIHIPGSIPLLLLKLQLCESLWETEKLINEWKRLVFHYPNNPQLWQQYLLFVQSNLGYFTVARTCKLYTKCIGMLNKILSGTFHSHRPPEDLEDTMLNIFFQYCTFLHRCGYVEKAVATFQALIEFNMFRPKTLSETTNLDDLKTFFEPFWDSGAPRFGEDGALGWDKIIAEKKLVSLKIKYAKDMNSEEDSIIATKDISKAQKWVKFEELREDQYWLPWRPDLEENDDCEDPERSVLVDDVSEMLFLLKSERTKFLLIIYFLKFLGVDFQNCYTTSRNNVFNNIFFERPSDVCAFLSSETFSIFHDDYENILKLPLFGEPQRFVPFINKIFEQSVKLFPSSHYYQYLILGWVKFHVSQLNNNNQNNKNYKQDLKNIKKMTKSLLKEENNRNNLLLWKEYGKLEWMHRKFEDAEKIFETALSTCIISEDGEIDVDIWEFVQTYVELLLGINEKQSFGISTTKCSDENLTKCLWILCLLGNNERYVPKSFKKNTDIPVTTVLKARNGFQNIVELEMHHSPNFIDEFSKSQCALQTGVICFCYFQYLSQGLKSARTVFEDIIPQLNNLYDTSNKNYYRTIMENIITSYLQLLIFHSTREIVSMKSAHSVLLKALELFPQNSYFLWLFLDLEVGSCVAGYFRRYFYKVLQEESKVSLMQWLFAVVAELRRHSRLKIISQSEGLYVPDTGVTWKIRSLFERALKSPKLCHSVLLWRMYMKFENQQNNQNRTKAIFYQALQHCPWAKILYIDGIKYLPEDIQEILDIMAEKGLRIRSPLEEIELLLEHNEQDKMEITEDTQIEEACS